MRLKKKKTSTSTTTAVKTKSSYHCCSSTTTRLLLLPVATFLGVFSVCFDARTIIRGGGGVTTTSSSKTTTGIVHDRKTISPEDDEKDCTSDNNNLKNENNIQQHPIASMDNDDDTDCNNKIIIGQQQQQGKGNGGRWVQDWEYAKTYGQYPEPRVFRRGPFQQRTWGKFQPSNEAPVPWETSWKWVVQEVLEEQEEDANNNTRNTTSTTSSSNSNDCRRSGVVSYELLQPNKVCNLLLYSLGINRILFWGDSITMSQFRSFVNMMGPNRTKIITTTKEEDFQEVVLTCNSPPTPPPPQDDDNNNNNHNNNNNVITIRGVRSTGGNAFPNSPRQPLILSNSTLDFLFAYNNNINNNNSSAAGDDGGRRRRRLNFSSLSVWNMGAHYHSLLEYQEDFDYLISQIQHHFDLMMHMHMQHNNNNDDYDHWVYFRTTPPGHLNCNPRIPRTFNFKAGIRDKPLINSSYYINTTKFDWHLFKEYNRYSIDKLKKLLQLQQRTTNSTTAAANSSSSNTIKIQLLDVVPMTILRSDGHTGGPDCLHYVEPGPIDWWNHLLLSKLQRQHQRHKMIWRGQRAPRASSSSSSCRGSSSSSVLLLPNNRTT